MKAVRVHTPGGPDAMRFEDAPEPTPKEGEALVKVDAAGLNYIDVYFRSGQYKAAAPFTLGMEAGGTVTAVGPKVTEVKVGDKVAYTGVPGAYAEYAAVPAARLVQLPAGLTTKHGAAMMLQVDSSWKILGYPGLAVAVFGLAALGGLWLVISIIAADRKVRRR